MSASGPLRNQRPFFLENNTPPVARPISAASVSIGYRTFHLAARRPCYCLKQYRLTSTDTPRLTPRGNSLLRGYQRLPRHQPA